MAPAHHGSFSAAVSRLQGRNPGDDHYAQSLADLGDQFAHGSHLIQIFGCLRDYHLLSGQIPPDIAYVGTRTQSFNLDHCGHFRKNIFDLAVSIHLFQSA